MAKQKLERSQPPSKISMDVMIVQQETGEVVDLLGYLEAPKYHEVIVYTGVPVRRRCQFLLHEKPDGKPLSKRSGCLLAIRPKS